jgi:hypothetical protein
MQTVINQAGGWIHFCMKLLRILNSNSRSKIKIKKPTSYNVLFKAYSMVLLSCRYNLAERYLSARQSLQSGPLAAASPVPDATGLPAAASPDSVG